MDSKDNFLKKFKALAAGLDEEYLSNISSKGLYKRAVRELDQGAAVEAAVKKGHVLCRLPGNIECRLTQKLREGECSCPALDICKHIIISFLYIKRNSDRLFREISEKHTPDYSALLNLSREEVIKKTGSRALKDILFRINFGVMPVIHEAESLSVKFREEGVCVKFPPNDLLEASACSCKKRGFCRHKAEAAIHYLLYKKKLTVEELSRETRVEIKKEVIDEVEALLTSILSPGIIRLPETIMEKIEQASLSCHNADFPNMEKLLKTIAGELKLYFQKNALFSRYALREKLARAFTILSALGSKGSNQNLIGEHRTSYVQVPNLRLTGLGAVAWETKSGYCGITVYFYSKTRKEWYTYTSAMPTSYEKTRAFSPAALYKNSAPWNLRMGLKAFSKQQLSLTNPQINRYGRISSTDEIQAAPLGVSPFKPRGLPVYDDWNELYNNLSPSFLYSPENQPDNFNPVILEIEQWDSGDFDKISQTYTAPVRDKNNKQLLIRVGYGSIDKKVIEHLENYDKSKHFPTHIMAKLFIRDNQPCLYPITIYTKDGEFINLTLD